MKKLLLLMIILLVPLAYADSLDVIVKFDMYMETGYSEGIDGFSDVDNDLETALTTYSFYDGYKLFSEEHDYDYRTYELGNFSDYVASLDYYFVLHFPSTVNKANLIAALKACDIVQYAGIAPEIKLMLGDTDSDGEYFEDQWSINGSATDHHECGGPDTLNPASNANIEVDDAWGVTTGNSNVKIIILDSGIDSDNTEFTGRIDLTNSKNFTSSTTTDIEDDYGHGTAVASVIAANSGNGNGIMGICQNAELLIARAFDDSGDEVGLYDALDYVVNELVETDADYEYSIVNCSWAGLSAEPSDEVAFEGYMPLLELIAIGRQLNNQTFVFAAGNGENSSGSCGSTGILGDVTNDGVADNFCDLFGYDCNCELPAFQPAMQYQDSLGKYGITNRLGITVGATKSRTDAPDGDATYESNFGAYSFSAYGSSDYGPWIDFVAPGEDILCIVPTTCAMSVSRNYGTSSELALLNGTSMSAAKMTGIIGLIQSHRYSETSTFFTPDEVYALLMHSSDALTSAFGGESVTLCGITKTKDYRYGFGKIDAYDVLGLVENADPFATATIVAPDEYGYLGKSVNNTGPAYEIEILLENMNGSVNNPPWAFTYTYDGVTTALFSSTDLNYCTVTNNGNDYTVKYDWDWYNETGIDGDGVYEFNLDLDIDNPDIGTYTMPNDIEVGVVGRVLEEMFEPEVELTLKNIHQEMNIPNHFPIIETEVCLRDADDDISILGLDGGDFIVTDNGNIVEEISFNGYDGILDVVLIFDKSTTSADFDVQMIDFIRSQLGSAMSSYLGMEIYYKIYYSGYTHGGEGMDDVAITSSITGITYTGNDGVLELRSIYSDFVSAGELSASDYDADGWLIQDADGLIFNSMANITSSFSHEAGWFYFYTAFNSILLEPDERYTLEDPIGPTSSIDWHVGSNRMMIVVTEEKLPGALVGPVFGATPRPPYSDIKDHFNDLLQNKLDNFILWFVNGETYVENFYYWSSISNYYIHYDEDFIEAEISNCISTYADDFCYDLSFEYPFAENCGTEYGWSELCSMHDVDVSAYIDYDDVTYTVTTIGDDPDVEYQAPCPPEISSYAYKLPLVPRAQFSYYLPAVTVNLRDPDKSMPHVAPGYEMTYATSILGVTNSDNYSDWSELPSPAWFTSPFTVSSAAFDGSYVSKLTLVGDYVPSQLPSGIYSASDVYNYLHSTANTFDITINQLYDDLVLEEEMVDIATYEYHPDNGSEYDGDIDSEMFNNLVWEDDEDYWFNESTFSPRGGPYWYFYSGDEPTGCYSYTEPYTLEIPLLKCYIESSEMFECFTVSNLYATEQEWSWYLYYPDEHCTISEDNDDILITITNITPTSPITLWSATGDISDLASDLTFTGLHQMSINLDDHVGILYGDPSCPSTGDEIEICISNLMFEYESAGEDMAASFWGVHGDGTTGTAEYGIICDTIIVCCPDLTPTWENSTHPSFGNCYEFPEIPE